MSAYLGTEYVDLGAFQDNVLQYDKNESGEFLKTQNLFSNIFESNLQFYQSSVVNSFECPHFALFGRRGSVWPPESVDSTRGF